MPVDLFPENFARILVPLRGDRDVAVGTGYAIRADLVLTARHVVDPFDCGSEEGDPAYVVRDWSRPIEVEFRGRCGGEGLTAANLGIETRITKRTISDREVRLPARADLDLALLRLDPPLPESSFRTTPLAWDYDYETSGVEWSSIGFARSLAGNHVESHDLSGWAYTRFPGDPLFWVRVRDSLEDWAGVSGAPVILSSGELIGVVVQQTLREPGGEWAVAGQARIRSHPIDAGTKPGDGGYAVEWEGRVLRRVFGGHALLAVPIAALLEDEALYEWIGSCEDASGPAQEVPRAGGSPSGWWALLLVGAPVLLVALMSTRPRGAERADGGEGPAIVTPQHYPSSSPTGAREGPGAIAESSDRRAARESKLVACGGGEFRLGRWRWRLGGEMKSSVRAESTCLRLNQRSGLAWQLPDEPTLRALLTEIALRPEESTLGYRRGDPVWTSATSHLGLQRKAMSLRPGPGAEVEEMLLDTDGRALVWLVRESP